MCIPADRSGATFVESQNQRNDSLSLDRHNLFNGDVPAGWKGIVNFALASLIYHKTDAWSCMPHTGALFATFLYHHNGRFPSNPELWDVDVLYPYNNRADESGIVFINLTGLPTATLIFTSSTRSSQL
jgi:hypothetical protein